MSTPRLHLEFAPQPRSLSWGGLSLLLVALALLAIASLEVARKWGDNVQQRQALAALEDKQRGKPPAPVRPQRADPAENARAQVVRQASRSLAMPWAELLGALESVPPGIALLSVDPSPAKQSVSITAEAAGAQEMLGYLKVLQADTRVAEVILVSHQVQTQAPGTPLRFQLRAKWGVAP
jgi:hypothetical protein